MSPTTAALILAWIVLLLLALAVAAIVRQVDVLSRLIPGGTQGSAVHPLVGLPLPNGVIASLAREGRSVVIVVSGNCAACHSLLADLASPRSGLTKNELGTLAIVSTDPRILPGIAEIAEQHIDPAEEARLQLTATPYGISAGIDAIVRTATPVGSLDALKALLLSTPQHTPTASL